MKRVYTGIIASTAPVLDGITENSHAVRIENGIMPRGKMER